LFALTCSTPRPSRIKLNRNRAQPAGFFIAPFGAVAAMTGSLTLSEYPGQNGDALGNIEKKN